MRNALTPRCAATVALALVGFLIIDGPVGAADRPVIVISNQALAPVRLEVHLGEQVRWRAAGGGRLRIELDDHPAAHEVIERTEEIKAVFLKPGEHSYSGTLVENGKRSFRGIVAVTGTPDTDVLPPVCSPESSRRICFEP